MNRLLFAAVVSALGSLSLVNAAEANRRTAKPLAELSAAVEELAQESAPAVVEISVKGRTRAAQNSVKKAGYVEQSESSGSGVILDPGGYILTNAHVVAGAKSIDVRVINSAVHDEVPHYQHFPAKTVGLDQTTDLAVLKIDAHDLPTLSFAEPHSVRQGQLVFALGSPMGLENSLTAGYVSTPVRYVEEEAPVAYIQTDAPINPGNSGGPLLNIQGQVVGINTLILSQSGGSEGLGLAIPSDVAQHIYERLKTEGRVRHGSIGVVAQDVTPILAGALGMKRQDGVLLSDIEPDSPAEVAGLKPNDLVISVDDRPLAGGGQLRAAIFKHSPGEKIRLGIARGDETLVKAVKVGEESSSPAELTEVAARNGRMIRPLGILALDLDASMKKLLPDLQRNSGVIAGAIPAELDGANPGLAVGDVIYEINGHRVKSTDELLTQLALKKAGDPVALLVESRGTLSYVTFLFE